MERSTEGRTVREERMEEWNKQPQTRNGNHKTRHETPAPASVWKRHRRKNESRTTQVEAPIVGGHMKVDPHGAAVISSLESEIKGVLGQPVILPCRYSIEVYGQTEMCWGRGRCPSYGGCNMKVLQTDGLHVVFNKAKYKLKHKIQSGDVSLIIDEISQEDNGEYCCRVTIPGLFNDQIININLVIISGSTEFLSVTPEIKTTGLLKLNSSSSVVPTSFALITVSADQLMFQDYVLSILLVVAVILMKTFCIFITALVFSYSVISLN
ncbi:T-cell immunoglobulin and mucin domain-containing protein 4-like [Protopterus annectens]|uniref:T-cell immunoglobulin and mucin domain-containing protein 4-like n=1 Tax=Protopterus annectens TaxID=7888 RepID=UPI001CF96764|nr:T-cell immunoglobulin and mucin domain-containing protein 4-like [Protopterus annectens]